MKAMIFSYLMLTFISYKVERFVFLRKIGEKENGWPYVGDRFSPPKMFSPVKKNPLNFFQFLFLLKPQNEYVML